MQGEEKKRGEKRFLGPLTFQPPERVSTTAEGPTARCTMALLAPEDEEEDGAAEPESLCRKASARETFAIPWSTSSLETERASFALAEEEEDELSDTASSSSLTVPHTPSVTSASTCLVSSKGSMTRTKHGCFTRESAAAPARAAARAASASSGESAEAASRERLSRSQTETSGRAAAEPERERERERG